MTSPTLDGLRASKKGNLIYDKYWLDDGRIEEVIRHCSSPPQISVDLLTAAFSGITLSHRWGEQDASHEKPRGTGSTVITDDPLEDSSCGKSNVKTASPTKINHSSNVESILVQLDQEQEQTVKERIKERRWQLEEHSKQVQEQAERNVALLAQQRELKQRTLVRAMSQAQREMEEMRERRLRHQQERHRLHVKRLDAKMKAAVLQREEEELERRKREKERQDFLHSFRGLKNQVDEAARKLLLQLDSCPHKEHLSEESNDIKRAVRALCIKAGTIVQEAMKVETFTDLDQAMQSVVQNLMQKQEESIRAIAEADRRFQEEFARKEKEREKEREAQEKERARQSEMKQSKTSEPAMGQDASLETSVSPEALSEYNSLAEKHKALEASFQGFSKSTDKDVKKYRFDLQKAVNTPINAVSVQSGAHLLDKMLRLQDLLSERKVELGTRRVVATRPAGLAYCKDLTAKKLVKQGDEQISSNHESAFAFAAIAVVLWVEIPDLGDLILHHFYQRCPFLLPYHMTKREDQSLEDYYKSLGYVYDSDGRIEKQDKYLKRMSGYTRLYAAIIATPPPKGKVHPHGIQYGWVFLARVLNLEPQPDITATTLFDFLEVCGYAMAEAYKKQFFKLLHTLYRSYFPRIEAVTPQGSGGPVSRLKGFLEDCLKTHRVPPPKGFLSQDFWRS